MGKTVRIYRTQDGGKPFSKWLNTIRRRDHTTYLRVRDRIHRIIDTGDYGDHKYLGEGVYELRLFVGPGYRIYFAEEDDVVVILLSGGDKSSQQRDILKAKAYWRDHRECNQ